MEPELFPESPTDFFLKSFDAKVTFTVDLDGRVTGLVTSQNGRERPAARVD